MKAITHVLGSSVLAFALVIMPLSITHAQVTQSTLVDQSVVVQEHVTVVQENIVGLLQEYVKYLQVNLILNLQTRIQVLQTLVNNR